MILEKKNHTQKGKNKAPTLFKGRFFFFWYIKNDISCYLTIRTQSLWRTQGVQWLKNSMELSVLWLVLPHLGYDPAFSDFKELRIRLLIILIPFDWNREMSIIWAKPFQSMYKDENAWKLYKVQGKTQKLLNRSFTTDFRWTRISLQISSNFLSLMCQQNPGDVNQIPSTLFYNKQKESFRITDVALT